MAQIQYTGLVSGMQGKLNGSVLSRGRSGNVIYKRPVQRLAPTPAQLGTRALFSAVAAAWRLLTTEERLDWGVIAAANPLPNRFGDLVEVSGYAYFQRMQTLATPFLSPVPLAPDLSADSVYEFSTVSAACDIELTDEGFLLTNVEALGESLNDSPTANQWNLYISLPVPDFGLPYFKTWYLIGQGTFSPGLGSAAALNFDVASVLLSTGFRSFDGAMHLLKGVCFIPDQGGVSVEQIWNFLPTWSPADTFPLVDPWNVGPSGIHPRWRASNTRIVGNLAMAIGDGTVDYDGIYTVKLKVAPIQAGTSQPAEGLYIDENAFTLLYDAPNMLHQLQTGSPYANMFAWLGFSYGTAVPDSVGLFIPIRLVFVDIATAAESPPRYVYWQIFEYP